MTKKKTGRLMENAHTEDPLDPEGGSPGQRSRTHAATAIQSSVKPEDYPAEERDTQRKLSTAGAKKAEK